MTYLPAHLFAARSTEPVPKPERPVAPPQPVPPAPAPVAVRPEPVRPKPVLPSVPTNPNRREKIHSWMRHWKRKGEEQTLGYFVAIGLAGVALLLVMWGALNLFPKPSGFPEKHLRAEHVLPKLKVKQEKAVKPLQPLPTPIKAPLLVGMPPMMGSPQTPFFKDPKQPYPQMPVLQQPILPQLKYQVARDPLTDNDYKVYLHREATPMYNPLKPSISSLVLAALMVSSTGADAQTNTDILDLKNQVSTLKGQIDNLDKLLKNQPTIRDFEKIVGEQLAVALKNQPLGLGQTEEIVNLKADIKVLHAMLIQMKNTPPTTIPAVPAPTQVQVTDNSDLKVISKQLTELTNAVSALKPKDAALYPPIKPEPPLRSQFEFVNMFDEDLLITINDEPHRVKAGQRLMAAVNPGMVRFQVRTEKGWVGPQESITLQEKQTYSLAARMPPR